MNTEEQLYVTAFNNGYILAKYEPIILSTISKNIPCLNNYLNGLFSGKKEYELEYFAELQAIRNKVKFQSKELENDS